LITGVAKYYGFQPSAIWEMDVQETKWWWSQAEKMQEEIKNSLGD
jgi:hypothetical protein